MLTLLTTSCVVGPNLKKPVNYLSGEHYSGTQSPSSGGIPLLLQTKNIDTTINGKLISNNMLPSNNVDVALYTHKEKLLATTQTNSNGQFHFRLKLKNGKYYISFLHNIRHFEVDSYKVQLGQILY